MMKSKIINVFSNLAPILENPTNELLMAVEKSLMDNKWFEKRDILFSLKAIAKWLNKNTLEEFCERYEFNSNPKNIAIICAGNIPAVGFHDFLCVILSGNKALCKLSSSDNHLLPAIAKHLIGIEPELKERIAFIDGKLEGFDAVIATGSNNTSRYFNYYFSKYPNIIRHSRSSLAIIQNSQIDYNLLMSDILSHKGLGCRNIKKIFIPNGFDFTPLIKASQEYSHLLDHNKFRNNYDYHKAIFIMNNIEFIDTGILLLRQSKEGFSPVSLLNYEYYDSIEQVEKELEIEKENIQCVVSDIKKIGNFTTVPFGKAQEPEIDDFADNVDTMLFCNRVK